jgi:hypothetical protein
MSQSAVRSLWERSSTVLARPQVILSVYMLLTIVASVQEFSLPLTAEHFTHYNNYLIFRQSFFHLIHSQDLYVRYPAEHWDFFKYSPAFALFMGAFAYLPELPGLLLWNALNVGVFFLGIRSLPFSDIKTKSAVLWFVVVEVLTALQNGQSNLLVAGLLLLAFGLLERRKIALATLMITMTVFIKLFGVVAFSLFFLYPDKKAFFFWSLCWMALFALVPMAVIPSGQLVALYQGWWRLLRMDYEGSLGVSVMGWLHSWFHFDPRKNVVTLVGVILLCLPLMFVRRFTELIFRLLFFCSVLIWIVIFNHKAESSTFIIAAAGAALWFFSQETNWLNTALILLAFVFTCLSPTEFFSRSFRTNVLAPYTIKAVPCILIWMKIVYELVSGRYAPSARLGVVHDSIVVER